MNIKQKCTIIMLASVYLYLYINICTTLPPYDRAVQDAFNFIHSYFSADARTIIKRTGGACNALQTKNNALIAIW